jgi:hypothetical protein
VAASLTRFDLECGRRIDAAFATFQGTDSFGLRWIAFAAEVHRRTQGVDDGSHNPLLVDGAGFVGFAGDHGGRSTFHSLADGCRAAAISYQFREYAAIQVAFASGDPVRLAFAIEASPGWGGCDLGGLHEDVHLLLAEISRSGLRDEGDAVADARDGPNASVFAIGQRQLFSDMADVSLEEAGVAAVVAPGVFD